MQQVLDLYKRHTDAVVEKDEYHGLKAHVPKEVDKMMKQSREITRKGIATHINI